MEEFEIGDCGDGEDVASSVREGGDGGGSNVFFILNTGLS